MAGRLFRLLVVAGRFDGGEGCQALAGIVQLEMPMPSATQAFPVAILLFIRPEASTCLKAIRYPPASSLATVSERQEPVLFVQSDRVFDHGRGVVRFLP